MLLRIYPLKLFKYWFVGYLIGVFLAVVFFYSPGPSTFWYESDSGNEIDEVQYICDFWMPPKGAVQRFIIAPRPPGIPDIDYLMHMDKGENRSVADALAQRIRVFCIVMTQSKYHENRAVVIKNTWGKRCDGLIFMSTHSDESLPAVALNTSKSDRLGRFKEAFQYVYHHHGDQADWFLKAEDDSYIIIENLKYMLNNYSSFENSYFGYMHEHETDEQQSPKAGYVLSKAALKTIVDWDPYKCNTSSPGDYQLSECLRYLNIKRVDTHDTAGHARFFPYNPSLLDQSRTGASDFAIAFHKISDEYLYLMEFFVYHLRAYGIVANYSVPEPYEQPRVANYSAPEPYQEPRVADYSVLEPYRSRESTT